MIRHHLGRFGYLGYLRLYLSHLVYLLRTWRCRILGHAWGPEQSECVQGITLERWRECRRKGCSGWWETYNYLDREEARARVYW